MTPLTVTYIALIAAAVLAVIAVLALLLAVGNMGYGVFHRARARHLLVQRDEAREQRDQAVRERDGHRGGEVEERRLRRYAEAQLDALQLPIQRGPRPVQIRPSEQPSRTPPAPVREPAHSRVATPGEVT